MENTLHYHACSCVCCLFLQRVRISSRKRYKYHSTIETGRVSKFAYVMDINSKGISSTPWN
ncbi:hypothetical protein NQ317_011969 [Molorchus minor]|uniref:Uncharacterized protein n=1 Tax=Molorchus minor TaxID=1323400 RepID=A0ABQ9IUC9_9CUCU|nr:hypothetical protein NQ317_011969 [Molorchus minor]